MTTRADLRNELRRRTGDLAATVWDDATLNGTLQYATQGVYPSYFKKETATTVAGVGPIQSLPLGCRNLYAVGVLRTGSTRVRPMRNWSEGVGKANVPKTGIEGQTLVWSWTSGFTMPANDTSVLDLTPEAEEVVILRAHIALLELLLSSRVKSQKYLALQVREGITEEDINATIDALAASVRERIDRAIPLPEVRS